MRTLTPEKIFKLLEIYNKDAPTLKGAISKQGLLLAMQSIALEQSTVELKTRLKTYRILEFAFHGGKGSLALFDLPPGESSSPQRKPSPKSSTLAQVLLCNIEQHMHADISIKTILLRHRRTTTLIKPLPACTLVIISPLIRLYQFCEIQLRNFLSVIIAVPLPPSLVLLIS